MNHDHKEAIMKSWIKSDLRIWSTIQGVPTKNMEQSPGVQQDARHSPKPQLRDTQERVSQMRPVITTNKHKSEIFLKNHQKANILD